MLKTKLAGVAGLSLLSLLSAGYGQAQGLGNSPYSRLGLGDTYMNTGGVRQMGMGGVGVAAPNGTNVNDLNPALVYYTSRTTYEAAFTGQFKTVSNNVSSQRDGSATLGYLALSFPISKRWAAAAGLKPYSAVDYQSDVVESVTGDPTAQVVKSYSGKGGLSEAYMTHAFRVAKGLSVGVSASYVFGTIDQVTSTTVAPAGIAIADLRSTVSTEHVHYSDFTFKGGAHYRNKLGDKLNYNVGGVYTFQSNLNGFRNVTLEQQVGGAPVSGSAIGLVSDQQSEAQVPSLAQLGVSIDNNKNWSTSLDVARQQWSHFEAFKIDGGPAGVPLNDTYRIGAGGEYTPDPTNVESYFKRVTYRAGLSVAEMPYRPGGQRLYDRAVSWGFAFPLPSATPLDATTINLAFTYGQRGNTNVTIDSPSGNIKENYIRMQLGVSLNNRWFIKRRIE